MRKKRVIVILLLALALVVGWVFWGNRALELHSYTVETQKLPESFHGFRIVQVSDLHNAQFGVENETLLKLVEEAKPDLIAITGDLIDSRKTKIDVALQFVEKAIQIAPCYYVTGNHEARIQEYPRMKQALLELGVVVLDNESVELKKKDEKILLVGVDDPSFQTDYLCGDA